MRFQNPQPHWHILGPGAIGSLWSAYWSQQNTASTLISRLVTQQVQLEFISNSSSLKLTQQHTNVQDLDCEITHLLITTKAHQCLDAYSSIKHLLSDDAIIIVLQNGMSVTKIPTGENQQLFAATTTDGAHFKNASTLVHAGSGETIIGPINPPVCTRETILLSALPQALAIKYQANIMLFLWRKLAINCAINALGVKYDCCNGHLLSDQSIAEELHALCNEITLVIQSAHPDNGLEDLYSTVAIVAEQTSKNINSTLQDIRKNKTTEIRELNGYLCELAASLNIASPLNQALLNIVIEKESHYKQP